VKIYVIFKMALVLTGTWWAGKLLFEGFAAGFVLSARDAPWVGHYILWGMLAIFPLSLICYFLPRVGGSMLILSCLMAAGTILSNTEADAAKIVVAQVVPSLGFGLAWVGFGFTFRKDQKREILAIGRLGIYPFRTKGFVRFNEWLYRTFGAGKKQL
jgi:hypothetical protein